MSVSFSSSLSLSLWDTFFCSILSPTAQLFYAICQPQTHIQLKSIPSLPRHNASDPVATGASDHTSLLICGFSVVLVLGVTSGRKAQIREECWKSKPVLTKGCCRSSPTHTIPVFWIHGGCIMVSLRCVMESASQLPSGLSMTFSTAYFFPLLSLSFTTCFYFVYKQNNLNTIGMYYPIW